MKKTPEFRRVGQLVIAVILSFSFLVLVIPGFAAPSGQYTLGFPSGVNADPSGQATIPAADLRDPAMYAPGYYDGDPLPPSTVYLSFDDGPGDFTADILNTLHDRKVTATFFINSFVRIYPAGLTPRC